MSVQSQGSAQETQNPVDIEEKSEKKDVVAYETHQRLLGEKKKRDEELRKANELLAKYELEKKQLEENSLREKEDYKKLFEAREIELNKTKEDLNSIQTQILESRKLKSFFNNVGTIGDEFLPLVELDKIAVDPNTGMPDETTAKQYADEFRKKYWKILDNGTSKIPENRPSPFKAGLTYEQWQKLPYSEQKKRLNEII